MKNVDDKNYVFNNKIKSSNIKLLSTGFKLEIQKRSPETKKKDFTKLDFKSVVPNPQIGTYKTPDFKSNSFTDQNFFNKKKSSSNHFSQSNLHSNKCVVNKFLNKYNCSLKKSRELQSNIKQSDTIVYEKKLYTNIKKALAIYSDIKQKNKAKKDSKILNDKNDEDSKKEVYVKNFNEK